MTFQDLSDPPFPFQDLSDLLFFPPFPELDLTKMAAGVPCLPAYVLAMCIRRADDVNDARRMQSLLNASIAAIKDVTQVGRGPKNAPKTPRKNPTATP